MSWLRVEELFSKIKSNSICDIEDLRGYYQAEQDAEVICTKCSRRMKQSPRSQPMVKLFRCSRCDTSKKIQVIKAKFETNYSTLILLRILCYFTLNISNSVISEILELDRNSTNSIILQILGDIRNYLEKDKLGSANGIVQLDESAIGKRKYNVGRTGNQTWIFGGIDMQTKRFFMQVVPDRKVVTIGPIIYANVEIGSTVWTDEHATYLAFFKDNPYFHHETVNHKKNFVNPDTGAHTQNIENLWSQFKKFKRQKSYTKIEYLELYIAEFTLRKRFERSNRWMFFEILLNLCFE